ncbi:hypothetical protein KI387_010826, partial [Taxus chinensis]
MARWIRGLAAASCMSCAAAEGFLAVAICVLAAVTVAAALCVRSSRDEDETRAGCFRNLKSAPRSGGRALMNTLSSKKLLFSKKWGRSEEDELEAYDRAAMEDGDFLWQKSILMGERCQPLNFSGLIVYDHRGNRLPEFPTRSPIFNL